ncbi:helix-turn-helix transcriptional regulator [Streptomyces sp. RY43-2]|uniref:Helix-turn-helix transcriptional regulator n=1 Tax=Streptomyces macrolidinus TaxID=2952607 RepID=A0ABT0ZB71_9ACTN|nr:helix-turn-helix transcriptional regulator [Streptomyces macrolidinus]MCN9241027.1 helix-turn-helix transcriptional regulator [Streptomyces macrolidinus]
MAEPGARPDIPESSLLALLGLDAEQEAVYRLLIDRPGSDPTALTPAAGNEEAVTRVLTTLVDSGLASAERRAGGVRYRAAPPVLSLGPLLESRRAALHRVEHVVTELADRHRAAYSRVRDAPVEVLSGAAAIRRWLVAIQRDARSEVRAMMPIMRDASVISPEDNLDEVERQMMRRGLTMRTVVERAWLEDPASARSLTEVAAQGQQISVTDKLPTKLLIADLDVAVLPLDPDRDEAGEPVALVVRRSGLLTALVSLFEQYFARGSLLSPLGPGRAGAERSTGQARLDAADRKIIALLHVGLTDAAIARQLDMSQRTVQRRVHQMMESVGVATRFQLGSYAAVSGWLDPGAPLGEGAPGQGRVPTPERGGRGC